MYVLVDGPLAQSVERRADNAKVVSSRLTWTTSLFFFLVTFMIYYIFLPFFSLLDFFFPCHIQ